jgi:hypothetical protein
MVAFGKPEGAAFMSALASRPFFSERLKICAERASLVRPDFGRTGGDRLGPTMSATLWKPIRAEKRFIPAHGTRPAMSDDGENHEQPTPAQLEAWLADNPRAQRILREMQEQLQPNEDQLPTWRHEVLLDLLECGVLFRSA